jgi:hypothetical protein
MLVDVDRALSGDDLPLKVLLRGPALLERQVQRLEPIGALPEAEDLVVGEHDAVVADDPKLELDVHGRRHAGVFRA